MTKLDWNASGKRYYEAGVDRGVLYVNSDSGVVWPGLISVSESPSGGDSEPYYFDGVKYLNVPGEEDFEATIEAFSAPIEFNVCLGIRTSLNGLLMSQQRRQPFGFSYRTRVGNDIDGNDHAYKIHLVYNATVSPSGQTHGTFGDKSDLDNKSWDITTLPANITGYAPSSHLVIDSRTTPKSLLSEMEDILYGSISAEPRLPSAQEVYTLFNVFVPPFVRDNGDGTITMSELLVTSAGLNLLEVDSSIVAANAQGIVTITIPPAE